MGVRIGIEALKRCVTIIGTQAMVGEIVGAGQSAISECIRRGRRVPAEWCIPIELATAERGEVVTRHQLRPDLFGEPEGPTTKPRPRRPRRPPASAGAAA